MTRTTGIEWTEHTWNPFVGCSIKSAGCANCYAMRMAARLDAMGQPAYAGTTDRGRWTGRINRASDGQMAKPDRIPGRALIFVNSMSDFWHEDAEDAWRAEALAVMRRNPRHRFQVLTKRPENIAPILARMGEAIPDNLWLGATVEDGRVKDRAAIIARVPARIRFLSVEPLIGPGGDLDLGGIAWVITGGESGPRARFCDPMWVRGVRDACWRSGVAFFHKQWGDYRSNPLVVERGVPIAEAMVLDPPENGKGGAMLDGIVHREIPSKSAQACQMPRP
jgi:protein gp37